MKTHIFLVFIITKS